METAKVFISGNSQAVRLPKEYRFDTDEVCIKKLGKSIIMYPKEYEFEAFLEGINGFSDDFMESGREQQTPQERAW